MLKTDYVKDGTLAILHERVEDSDARLIQDGNNKTGKHGKFGTMFVTRGLPIWDCPNSTVACRKACYAIKFLLWNTENSKLASMGAVYSKLAHNNTDKLYDRMDNELKALESIYRKIVIRIHEAGDFVSYDHADVYLKLAIKYPDVHFFGYSRAFVNADILPVLNALNALPNVVIRESLDNERYTGTGDASLAFFGDKDKEPTRSFKCVEQLTKGDNAIKCIDCGLCWTQRSLNVVFKKH
jgi:hypothetical protein